MPTPQPQTSRSRARTLLFSLAALLIAIGLAWTLGEVLVRAFSAMDRINVHPRRLYTASEDPRRHYQLRPDQRDLVVQGKNVRIDSLGMRGERDDPGGSPDAQRVLVVGDSVVFGWGLDEAETFSVRLEQELRGRGRSARVLNGGTPGYNTLSELAALEALASRLDPDLVVLGVSLNDFTVTPGLSPQGYLTTRELDDELSWLDRNSELYVLWRWFLGSGRIAGLFSEQARSQKGRQLEAYFEKRAIALREKFYREPTGEGFERIQGALRAIRAFTQERDIDLVVVVFPERDQVEAQEDAPTPQRRWAQWCGELELRCLDLQSTFLESSGRGELFNDLQHPNAAGIAAAARATADLLESSRPRRPNVLLYVSDTLRADSLARYGNPVVKTPNLDALARDGTLFLNAYAPSSWTRASVASIMTGLYPDLHAAEERDQILSENLVLLSETFSAQGYATGAIVTNPNAGAIYGFDQGFDDFIETYQAGEKDVVTSAHEVVASDRVSELAIEWIGRSRRPFFLFVLAIDPHWPYQPPPEFDRYGGDYSGRVDHDELAITRADLSSADRARIRSLYDAEVTFNDDSLGHLIRYLQASGIYDDTIILFTSDHGEEFWEHGRAMHGTALYEESLRVPLILRYPKGVPVARRVKEPVELIDISATLLELTGIALPHPVDGRSLLGPPSSGPASELRERHARLKLDNHHIEAVTAGPWKLVRNRRSGEDALYNLEMDPEESWNLAGRHPERVAELVARLESRKQASSARSAELRVIEGSGTVTDEELPEGMRKHLEALGYIDASTGDGDGDEE